MQTLIRSGGCLCDPRRLCHGIISKRGRLNLHCTQLATWCCFLLLGLSGVSIKCAADYSCIIHIIPQLFRNNSGLASAIKILKVILT